MARKRDVVKKIDQKSKSTGAPLPLIQEDQPAPPAFYLIPAPDTLIEVGQAIFRSTQAPMVSVALSWQEAPNIAPDYYNVEWDESSSFTDVQRKRASTTSATIDGLKANGVTYYFRVQAVLGGIYSPFSETLTVVTMNDTTPPPDVTGLSATFINGDLYISWTKPLSEIYKDAEIRIYNAAHTVLYATLYSAGESIVWSVAQNFAATGGVGTTSVSIDVLSRSWGNTYSTGVNTTATSSVPDAPVITTSWDSDIGLADEDLLITWPAVTNTDSYDIVIDGETYKTKDLRFVYRYETNVAQHVPTLASGDMNLTLAVYARNRLNQVSTPDTATVANLAPPTAYIELDYTTGFSQIAANVSVASGAIIQDFDHWEWTLTDGVSTIQAFNSTTNDVIFALNASGTYNIGVKAVDKFNQKSADVTVSSIIMDVLTIEHLRAEAIYTDDVGNSQTTLDALKDGSNATTVGYAGTGAGVWHWTKVERPLVERYGQISINVQSGTPLFYVGLSLDDVTYDWYSGTLSGTYLTKLLAAANETTAKSLAITTAELTYGRIDIPTVKEARYVKIGHRSDSAYTLGLLYPRRLLQTDDFEAETVSTINLKAAAVTADKISVINLEAVSADMGNLHMDGVIDIESTGGIYQGSGTFASPTTGLKIFNSSGVGKLSTYNTGVEQVTLDTDGKFKAGAGNVRLDADGIQIITPASATYETTSSIDFFDNSGNRTSSVRAYNQLSINTLTLESTVNGSRQGSVSLAGTGSGSSASLLIQGSSGSNTSYANMAAKRIEIRSDHSTYSGVEGIAFFAHASSSIPDVLITAGLLSVNVDSYLGTTYIVPGSVTTSPAILTVDGLVRIRNDSSIRYRSDISVSSAGLAQNVYDDTGAVYKDYQVSSAVGRFLSGSGSYIFHMSGTGSGATTNVEIGAYGSGNRYAHMDFIGDDTYTDYGMRIIRNNTGANATSEIAHRGTGDLRLTAIDAGSISFYTSSAQVAAFGAAGNLGLVNKLYIGGTGTVPSYQIHLSTDSAGKPTTSTWSVISDSRSKKNVSNRVNALERISKLQIKDFDFTGDFGTEKDKHGVGVVAEDLQVVYPNSVRTVDIDGQQVLAVDYHEVYIDALIALQEITKRLEMLEARNR